MDSTRWIQLFGFNPLDSTSFDTTFWIQPDGFPEVSQGDSIAVTYMYCPEELAGASPAGLFMLDFSLPGRPQGDLRAALGSLRDLSRKMYEV